MNFQQLRIVRETVRRNFNLTEVAGSLFTSQSGVSKHIKDLEDELGVELFVRRGKRLLGLTDPGKEMVEIVERMLVDTANIKRLGEQFSNREQGQIVIATTHTQARYVLPKVLSEFADLQGVANGRMLSLNAVAQRKLQARGVTLVDSFPLCTSCHPELFFSHRRDNGVTGRQAGLVWLT